MYRRRKSQLGALSRGELAESSLIKPCSSRRKEAHSVSDEEDQSLLTSAATFIGSQRESFRGILTLAISPLTSLRERGT